MNFDKNVQTGNYLCICDNGHEGKQVLEIQVKSIIII